jgi:hypothetical protein
MIEYSLRPGASGCRENRYAFYIDKYWLLKSRRLITYPGLGWIPDSILRFVARHSLDVVHAVHLVISPDKPKDHYE